MDKYERYEADWESAEGPPNFDLDTHVKNTWEWFRNTLNSPKFIVAPMVDASELPWRVLSRRYNSDLCYTPMIHAANYVKDATYRRDNFPSSGEFEQGSPNYDRPLFVQFCANDADAFSRAAQLVEDRCDAVDLNLGCPQLIAKRGHYGAHMMEDWSKIRNMIEKARITAKVRITAKIRKFDDDLVTLRYAKMLQNAGVSVLTIHGRTRDQRGPNTGLADWKIIKKVKEVIRVPVFANGNIQCLHHAHDCIAQTGVDGIMTAEGNLYNPALFAGISPPSWKMATEYINLAKVHKYPTLSCVRGHIFKLLHHVFQQVAHRDLRDNLAQANDFQEISKVTEDARTRLEKTEADVNPISPCDMDAILNLPYWRCKPYVRPKVQQGSEQVSRKRDSQMIAENDKRKEHKAKKQAKYQEKIADKETKLKYPMCIKCPGNPRGMKCLFKLCKSCCKKRLEEDDTDCLGHRIYGKPSREAHNRERQSRLKESSIVESPA